MIGVGLSLGIGDWGLGVGDREMRDGEMGRGEI